MSFVFYLASLRSSESCQGVGRNTHFYPFPTCAQAFWVEGEQLQSPGRKCGRFLPTVSVQPAGASTDSEAMHHLVSRALGWRLSAVILPDWIGRRSEIEVFNQFGCRSILVTATPFFPAKFISPHTWDFGEFLTLVSQTFLHWICIFFALFTQLFDYLACLSSEL